MARVRRVPREPATDDLPVVSFLFFLCYFFLYLHFYTAGDWSRPVCARPSILLLSHTSTLAFSNAVQKMKPLSFSAPFPSSLPLPFLLYKVTLCRQVDLELAVLLPLSLQIARIPSECLFTGFSETFGFFLGTLCPRMQPEFTTCGSRVSG